MSKCVNCGGEQRFDIASQMLICSSCGSKEDPKDFTAEGSYAERPEMEFTFFECPQCGGKVYSTDNSINGFCSYCGSNVMLKTRVEKKRMPRSLAPFKISKEACKIRYLNYVKKAWFIPKELKEAAYLDNFRGIYMPYWGYDVRLAGFLSLDGVRSFREGKKVYTENYKCRGWLDARYQGIFYDASAAFDDHFSWQIAPFDAHSLVDFNPAYLSGFYADLGDVDYHVYDDNATRIARDKVFDSIQLHKAFPYATFSADQLELFRPTMDAEVLEVYSSLFPVWFLSHRTDDRVSYAVVNGQTGRIAGDMPVDKKKFLLVSVLEAIPLFVLLCFSTLMEPSSLLVASEFFAVISITLLMSMIKKIIIRDRRLDDKGYLSGHDRNAYLDSVWLEESAEWERDKKKELLKIVIAAVLAILMWTNALGSILGDKQRLSVMMFSGLYTLLVEVMAINCTRLILSSGLVKTGRMLAGIWIVFFATLMGLAVTIFMGDVTMAYYIAIVLIMAGTLMSQLVALEQYNIMTSLPLPQLDRQGGE